MIRQHANAIKEVETAEKMCSGPKCADVTASGTQETRTWLRNDHEDVINQQVKE